MRRSNLPTVYLASFIACAAGAGVVAAEPAAKNLNSVPEDNLGGGLASGPDNPFIRQTLNARPNEDLVICVAGCFSGRERVVYSQPADKPDLRPVMVRVKETEPTAPAAAPTNPNKAPGPSTLNDDKPAAGSASKGQQSSSFDPHAPSILNAAARFPDKSAAAADAHAPAN